MSQNPETFSLLLTDRRAAYATVADFCEISRDEISALQHGEIVYVRRGNVAVAVRISGQAKLWKRDKRARIPWKYGLYLSGEAAFGPDGEIRGYPILRMIGESSEVFIGRERKIEIATPGGVKEIPARSPDGIFALHESAGEHGWTVTHIRSGLATVSGKTRSAAVNTLRKIAAAGSDFTNADRDIGTREALAEAIA